MVQYQILWDLAQRIHSSRTGQSLLAKFQNLMTTPSVRKLTKAETGKNGANSGHFVLPATPKNSARTSL
jgi:hypothetical protein